MTKLLLLFVILIFSSGVTLAQRWEIAPQIGFNAGLPGENHIYPKYGFDLGVAGAYKFGSFAVEADLMYSWVEYCNFLYLPIKAKYYIGKGFNVFAGPQFNFYLDKDPFIFVDGGRQNIPNYFMFAVMGGIGYRFEKGYNISVAYNYNITKINYNSRYDYYNGNMQAFKVVFGKYFKLGR